MTNLKSNKTYNLLSISFTLKVMQCTDVWERFVLMSSICYERVAFVDIHLAERRVHDIRKLVRFHARLRHQIFQFKSRNIDKTF